MKNIFKQFSNPFKPDYAKELVRIANNDLYEAKLGLVRAKQAKLLADARLSYLEKYIVSLNETVAIFEGEKHAKENIASNSTNISGKQSNSAGYRIPVSS